MEYVLTSKMFMEAFRKGKFLGLKCRECKAFTAPPQKVCSGCNSEDLEVVELSGKGEIQTFTVIHVPAEGFVPPYVVGLIQLEEGPWVVADILDVEPQQATMELIGQNGEVGYKEIPADSFSGGDRIALTLKIN
jgi:uncharacterized OB-fold protein